MEYNYNVLRDAIPSINDLNMYSSVSHGCEMILYFANVMLVTENAWICTEIDQP